MILCYSRLHLHGRPNTLIFAIVRLLLVLPKSVAAFGLPHLMTGSAMAIASPIPIKSLGAMSSSSTRALNMCLVKLIPTILLFGQPQV